MRFMDSDFLLKTDTARRLFAEYAKDLPIIDYHCHINPKEILENKSYENITQLWLSGDHYKWRLMRANGVDEAYCTGSASDREKFDAFCRTLPYAPGNPVYHWSHLELRRFFGMEELICPENADAIWEKTAAKLGETGLRCRDLIEMSNVQVICTTDDPADDLAVHAALATQNLSFKVLPAWRPDKALDVNNARYSQYVKTLGTAASVTIDSYAALKEALNKRMEFFDQNGCKVSDHALLTVDYCEMSPAQMEAAYAKALASQKLSAQEEAALRCDLLLFLGRQYARLGWVMQYHISALRNNNARMFGQLGADCGFDSLNDTQIAQGLSCMLNALDSTDELPRTILYSLNPKDNYTIATMIGNFQRDIPGKLQMGSSWWFMDNKLGMQKQMEDLANLGLLGRFIGMLTDSRSYLSYTRHEYFRRIFCNLLGEWVENGEFPDSEPVLKMLTQGVCYTNAKEYFRF